MDPTNATNQHYFILFISKINVKKPHDHQRLHKAEESSFLDNGAFQAEGWDGPLELPAALATPPQSTRQPVGCLPEDGQYSPTNLPKTLLEEASVKELSPLKRLPAIFICVCWPLVTNAPTRFVHHWTNRLICHMHTQTVNNCPAYWYEQMNLLPRLPACTQCTRCWMREQYVCMGAHLECHTTIKIPRWQIL